MDQRLVQIAIEDLIHRVQRLAGIGKLGQLRVHLRFGRAEIPPLAIALHVPIATVVQVHPLRQVLVGFAPTTHVVILPSIAELRQIYLPAMLLRCRDSFANGVSVQLLHSQGNRPVCASLEFVAARGKPARLGAGPRLTRQLLQDVGAGEYHDVFRDVLRVEHLVAR